MIKTTIQIGKNGITEALVAEIKKQLKKKKTLRLKLTRGFVDSLEGKTSKEARRGAMKELCDKTNTELDSIVGFVAVIKKI